MKTLKTGIVKSNARFIPLQFKTNKMKITFSKTYEIDETELREFVKNAEPTTEDETEQYEMLAAEIFNGELPDLTADDFEIV